MAKYRWGEFCFSGCIHLSPIGSEFWFVTAFENGGGLPVTSNVLVEK